MRDGIDNWEALRLMAGILICDDNPNIRYLLRVFVESQTSFKVCGEAGHGTEAIEKAKKLQPELILLDLNMPLLNGAEAAGVLKAMLPRTKIILFSMHMDMFSRQCCRAPKSSCSPCTWITFRDHLLRRLALTSPCQNLMESRSSVST